MDVQAKPASNLRSNFRSRRETFWALLFKFKNFVNNRLTKRLVSILLHQSCLQTLKIDKKLTALVETFIVIKCNLRWTLGLLKLRGVTALFTFLILLGLQLFLVNNAIRCKLACSIKISADWVNCVIFIASSAPKVVGKKCRSSRNYSLNMSTKMDPSSIG